LLVDRLPVHQEGPVLAHVEDCSACQQTLEQLTAASSWGAATNDVAPALTPADDTFWRGLKAVCPDWLLTCRPGSASGLTAAEPAEAEDASLPAQLGRYELLEEIGRGGMGAVFRARDPNLNRPLAVKVLLAKHRGQPELENRFLEEAQVTGQLQHPGIPSVHELGRLEDGRPFFAMKLVQGQTLAALLQTDPDHAPDRPRLLAIFGQVCQALAYAHSRGVLHRDLKPANVMVGAFGEVQVMDWGLAKVLDAERARAARPGPAPSPVQTLRTATTGVSSQAGAVLGTLAYMPPEQALGRVGELDERADVFGLGAILCEILTGQPPYAAREGLAAHGQAAGADLADAFARLDGCGADAELVHLAKACLAPERADRRRDAGVVARDVAAYQEGVEQRLRRAELERARAQVRATEERKRRRLTAALAAAALALVLLAAGGGLWLQAVRAERHAEAARHEQTLRQEVEAALTQAASFRQGFHFPQAHALLEQARLRLDPTGPDDLRRRLEQALADLHLAERLDAARLQPAIIVKEELDVLGTEQRYAAAFAEASLGREKEDAETVAARVRDSALREELVAALDDWAGVTQNQSRRVWLSAVARGADPNRWRGRLRQPEVWGERAALIQLAREAKKAALSPQLAASLGRALRQRGADAVPLLAAAHARFPQDFWLNFELAAALCGQHRWDEAVGYHLAALALRPRASAVQSNLGYTLEAKGRLDEAIAHYQQALDLDPKVARVHYNLGNALAKKRRLDEAIAHYQQALDLDPKDVRAHTNLGFALQAKGRLDEAIDRYRQALAIDPKDAMAHYNLGNALLARGRVDDAFRHRQRAVRLDPKDPSAHYNLGNVLETKGRLDDAIDCYRRALALDPKDARVHNNLGYVLQAKGRLDDALAHYQQAVYLDPRDSRTHTSLGYALYAKGRLDEAIDHYRQALDLDPKLAQAHGALGQALLSQGHFHEAQAATRRGLDLLPQSHPLRSTVTQQLQRCEQMLAREDRLPAVLQDQDKPAEAADYVAFAELCSIKKQYAAAVRLYAEAFAAKPQLADDVKAGHRYNAACAAVLAAGGQGTDTVAQDGKERARWRHQGLDWLRADLAAWAKAADRDLVQRTLQHWHQDSNLAGARDREALAKLPATERQAWTEFWFDVVNLLKKARDHE
jgi:tetratricopeptide (TPR) repeat protein